MKRQNKKPKSTLFKVFVILTSIIIGVGGTLLWYNYWPTYTNRINKISQSVVELQERGDNALLANDTQLMEQVAQGLSIQYKRLNDLTPDSELIEYNTSVLEWTYLTYLGAEESVSLGLVTVADEAVAKEDHEALERVLENLQVQKVRLENLPSIQRNTAIKFLDYQFLVIEWITVTIEAGQEIVAKQLPPESGQIVWGAVPVFPALVDIPIDGGIFASLRPVYGVLPEQAFYNIPPNSSLWDSITSITPTCGSIAHCYEVSEPDPPFIEEPPPFITGIDGSKLEASPGWKVPPRTDGRTVSGLPAGFPTNLSKGTYQLSVQICTSVTGCLSSGQVETLKNVDAGYLAQQVSSALSQTRSPSSDCSVSTSYTPFDGSSFTARQVITCRSGDQSVTSTIVIRIQKI